MLSSTRRGLISRFFFRNVIASNHDWTLELPVIFKNKLLTIEDKEICGIIDVIRGGGRLGGRRYAELCDTGISGTGSSAGLRNAGNRADDSADGSAGH